MTALSASTDQVWVGTTGGVYSYTVPEGEVTRYTNVEGLHALRVTAITHDALCGGDGCVWIGYGDGALDRLDVDTGTITTFLDIQRADRYPSRTINGMVVQGDSLLIATNFGLVVFDKAKSEIRDTYDHLGSAPTAIPVYDAAVAEGPDGEEALWLATEEGVAGASMRATNLKDPTSWILESTGLPAPTVLSLAVTQGALYAGTAKGLARREVGGSYTTLPVTTWAVTRLQDTPEGFIGLDQFSVLLMGDDGKVLRLLVPGIEQPADIALIGDTIWVGDPVLGLVPTRLDHADGPKLVPLKDCQPGQGDCYPAGPYFGIFTDLDVDGAGNLWTTGVTQRGSGFHRLSSDGVWTDFLGATIPALQGRNGFTQIDAGPDGAVWAASYGGGLTEVTPGDEVTVYTQENSTLRAPEGEANRNYITTGGVGIDANGYVWATNIGASRPLHVRTPDGAWTALPLPSGCGLTSSGATLGDVFVDSFGQKWITVPDMRNFRHTIGLMVLDTRDTPTDPSDDQCQFFRQGAQRGQGLPSDTVKAVAESGDGFIWVATAGGLAYTLNTGVVARDANATFAWPLYDDRSQGTYVLQGLSVNDIAIDPANRIWAVTSGNGVWLLQSTDGAYAVQAHFTTQNSPLPSDDVFAVAVDPLTGEVFFSTSEGMVGYLGDAIQAVEEATDLLVYPNPVRALDGSEVAVYIDGLVASTEVMILAPDGTLVKRFAAQGGRAMWDGKDANQRPVPAGVYLVVAVGRDGEGAAYGKVALIR